MKRLKAIVALMIAVMMVAPNLSFAANHREAPITALDRLADITDYFSFVSYDDPSKVTFLLNVDPLLEPSNGPNYFPFDPNILYEIKIDNNQDAIEDITFQFRFQTEIRLPPQIPRRIAEGIYTSPFGQDNGRNAPPGGPAGAPPGTPIVPPAVTALDGPGSEGLILRQSYSVAMVRGNRGNDGRGDNNGSGNDNGDDDAGDDDDRGGDNRRRTDLTGGRRLIALPSNVGPRTMPTYEAPGGLFQQGINDLGNGVRVFAGTVDDPFWIDLGAAFDTGNLRGTGLVLSPGVDGDDFTNINPEDVAGYNVNVIAIEAPIAMLTRTGRREPATSPAATIGSWGTTSRQQVTIRRTSDSNGNGSGNGNENSNNHGFGNGNQGLTFEDASRFQNQRTNGQFRQVARMANALTNELFVGIGFKDVFSVSEPVNDFRFSRFFFDPYLARQLNAQVPLIRVPDPPRNDLRPLYQYLPPIAAPGTPPGPIADLLRLNTGVLPTPPGQRSRLGLVGNGPRRDQAGYPNGRRVQDDVTDITLRLTAGVFNPAFNIPPNNILGDAVNVNDTPQFETFPYVWFAHDGRNSRHIDPGEPGCTKGQVPPCTPPDENP